MTSPKISPQEAVRLLRAERDRIVFEVWAKQEGIEATPAPEMLCQDGRFPATYWEHGTETAWRAWANKPAEPAQGDAVLSELPEWTKRDDLGGLVPSEIRSAMHEYGRACILQSSRIDEAGRVDEVKDAARYQWLRELPRGFEHGELVISLAMRQPEPNRWKVDTLRGNKLDAAIDQAITKEVGKS